MKKVLDYIKANKTVLIILSIIFVLIIAVVAMNGINGDKDTINSVSTAAQSNTEKRLSDLLSNISGVGKTQVMITEDDEGIAGVVIVCDGANNIMTRNNILNAVSTALNVEKNIIAIYAMN